jgi:transcription initiation factor TFIIIB Brf1 subunit/transcription initiation factor TFIIB
MNSCIFDIAKKLIAPKSIIDECSNSLTCPMCHSSEMFVKDHEEMCLGCGINTGSAVDYKPSWRNDVGDDINRCNLVNNEALPQSSFSTCMLMGQRASKVHYDLQRTIVWTSIPYHERSLRNKMEEISITCKEHDIPEAIIEYAQRLYTRVIQELESRALKRKRGNNDTGLRAASVFYAFQDDGKPRNYKEIASMFKIEPKYVSDGIKLFTELIRPDSKVAVYSDFIDVLCDGLGIISDALRDRISDVADRVNQLGILENSTPTSVVAGCIYYVIVENALDMKISEIASKCNVSQPTITKVCNKLFRRSIDLADGGTESPRTPQFY